MKLDPLSEEEKPKLALVDVVLPDGPESIVVLGALVSGGGAGASTVQLRVADEASVLPAPSVAFTEKVWLPTASELYSFGEMQSSQAEESSWHWKLEPLSEEEKPKLALVETVFPDGPESIVVLGALVSAEGGGSCGGVGEVGVIGGGAGGPAGAFVGFRGSEPAVTSAPSPNPSPSVSNL